jgi:hypothetical protein
MKALVYINAAAWGIVLLNNAALLAIALAGHRSSDWTFAAFLFGIPALLLALPFELRARRWTRATIALAIFSLVVWVPAMLYCLQFWDPDRGG